MRRSFVEAQEHGFVDPVGEHEEQEGQDVDGKHPSRVRHPDEKQRQEVRVSRLSKEGRADERTGTSGNH